MWRIDGWSAIAVLVAGMGCANAAPAGQQDDAGPQERQCIAHGWRQVVVEVDGMPRRLLWKAPPSGAWTGGAILVLHGGGGRHFHWCTAHAPAVASQVRFSELALAQGHAVFLLDSSDQVRDNEGRVCGKVWDDEVRRRPNLDLPFIGQVMRDLVPRLRPAGSRRAIFLTGLSSGGYMTVRAATHFADLVTAFAPVSSGDPYGWHRICEAGTTSRIKVHGAGYDNETGRQIIERDACRAGSHPHEQPWDGGHTKARPAFRLFHHETDGVNDLSCAEKAGAQLRRHGYPGAPDFLLQGGRRSVANHLWQDAYSREVLAFFASRADAHAEPEGPVNARPAGAGPVQ